MFNTNDNCATCDHKKNADGGWCYMFALSPKEPCMQHTGEYERIIAIRMQHAIRTAKKMGVQP